jgi:MFS family permease
MSLPTTITKTNTRNITAGPWMVVFLLCIVGALNYLDRTMITTMRSSIVSDMPMSDTQFGLLTSAFLWIYGILSPFAGWLADRFSRSRVIILSLLVWSLVTFLTSYARTFEQLLATRIFMGISEACYIPAALALISDYHSNKTRSFATGIHIAGIYVGGSLGFIGGWISENHHWGYAFHVFGLVGIAYASILFFLLKDAPARQVLKQEHLSAVSFGAAAKNLFASTVYIRMLFFWGLMGIVGWMVMGWLPTYYKEHFRLRQGLAGLYATGYLYPASIAGLIIGGFIADRWARRNSNARILVPMIGLLVASPCIFLASDTSVLPLAIFFFIVYAFTYVFTDANLMPILCMVSDQRYRATGYGILNMFATIIGGLGLFGGGYLRDAHVNLSLVFKSAAIILLICAGILYSIFLLNKNRISEQ